MAKMKKSEIEGNDEMKLYEVQYNSLPKRIYHFVTAREAIQQYRIDLMISPLRADTEFTVNEWQPIEGK